MSAIISSGRSGYIGLTGSFLLVAVTRSPAEHQKSRTALTTASTSFETFALCQKILQIGTDSCPGETPSTFTH